MLLCFNDHRIYDFWKIRTLHLWSTFLAELAILQEAENMINVTPCKPHVAPWRALLCSCKIHGNLEMGECNSKQIFEMVPENAAGYMLLSNIYDAVGNTHLCENVEQHRKARGVKKQLGHTWIEVNNEVHTIVVDDQDHPQISEIHAELLRLPKLMHDAWYVP